MLPYTYVELQQFMVDRRRQQQQGQNLVGTAADLAAKLRAFASDAIVVKHLIEFALPSKKRSDAAEVTAKVVSAAAENQNTTKKIKQHDDTGDPDKYDVVLSQDTANTMADAFFKFIEQEHLEQHLSAMSAGQILTLCIFHSRLSWQKGKPLQLHDRDHYWIPKPTYTPVAKVNADSPPYFVQRIKQSATQHVQPEMQPPCICLLCGKGFISWPALWNHCDREHHSWAEATKRILWEAEQLEAMPLLPPDKRRIIQNFTNALIYSKPAEGHFGREKVCMRQRIGCATCAKVSWIENCFPCFLFQDCPDGLRPRSKNESDGSQTEASEDECTDEDASAKQQR